MVAPMWEGCCPCHAGLASLSPWMVEVLYVDVFIYVICLGALQLLVDVDIWNHGCNLIIMPSKPFSIDIVSEEN